MGRDGGCSEPLVPSAVVVLAVVDCEVDSDPDVEGSEVDLEVDDLEVDQDKIWLRVAT
jgi:hypothetical protein